MVRMKNN